MKTRNNGKIKTLTSDQEKIVDALRIKGYEADIAWDMVKAKFPDK